MAVVSLLAFFVLAVTNWIAVAQEWKEGEYVVKPATLAALVLFAASSDDPSHWLIAALVASLLGDVYLMLPSQLFSAGLAAFLLAHFAYIAAFDAPVLWRFVWMAALGAGFFPIVRRIIGSIDDEAVKPAVIIYAVVLSFMVASAIASGNPVAAMGAALFFASDSLLAWNRFVQPVPQGHLLVMVTYQLGQLGLVIALR